jgi:HNH endonuclease
MTVIQGFINQPHITKPGRGAEFGSVPLRERFWAKVLLGDNCWEWIGCLSHGRAVISVDQRPKAAAIVSWKFFRGEIPAGIKVCHACDNPKCVRPGHLFLGTQHQNILDAKQKGRLNKNRKYRPERASTARLNWALVRQIRADDKATLADLAKKYSVCIATVSNVRNQKTWIDSSHRLTENPALT